MTSVTANGSALLQNYINSNYKTTDTTATVTAEEDSKTSLVSNFNTFLKMLTTQLENQDPLAAMDTNQFTQELVAFSGVEQQLKTNDNLSDILSSLNSNGITPLISYVGNSVEADAGGKIVLENSVAAFSYTLPSAASSVTIKVKDADGKTVSTVSGPTTSGAHRLAWDGTCTDESTAEDGTYSVTVTALDSDGKTLKVSDLNLIGNVSGITTDKDGKGVLSVGDLTVSVDDVVGVYSGFSAS